jgi:hypothetical protein
MIRSDSILRSISCNFTYKAFNLIPVLLSTNGPAFLMYSSALLYSCNICALRFSCLTRFKKFVIESAILIRLNYRATLPASANLS